MSGKEIQHKVIWWQTWGLDLTALCFLWHTELLYCLLRLCFLWYVGTLGSRISGSAWVTSSWATMLFAEHLQWFGCYTLNPQTYYSNVFVLFSYVSFVEWLSWTKNTWSGPSLTKTVISANRHGSCKVRQGISTSGINWTRYCEERRVPG